MPPGGIVGIGKEDVVLSDYERRTWDDIERFWAEDAHEPARVGRGTDVPQRPTSRKLDAAPVSVVGAVWTAIFLVLFDAQAAGLAVAAGAALGLALWRYWQLLNSGSEAARPGTGKPPTPDGARRRVETTYHGRLWRWSEDG